MEIQKLNPMALKMANDIMAIRPSISLPMAMNMVNSLMANITTQCRVKLDIGSAYTPAPCNLYSLTLASSGSGKNSGIGLLTNFYFKDAFDYMAHEVYPKFKANAISKLENDGNERKLHSWTKWLQDSTLSGFLAYCESFHLAGFGSINLMVDEIGNAILTKSDLFEMTLGIYDNGEALPVAKRIDTESIDITGMSVNLYSQGNTEKLLNGDVVEASFMRYLSEGGARRTIFVNDTSSTVARTAEEIMAEMVKAKDILDSRAKDRDYIRLLITTKNLNKVLTMTNEALYFYSWILAEGEALVSEHKGMTQAVKSDLLNRNFKAAKLAGIYAFFDKSDVVEKKHLEQAYEIIKDSSEVLMELTKIRPLHERLLDKLIDEDNKITAQSMLGYPFINSTWTKKIEEIIKLAKELASEKGIDWKETKHKGVTYYRAGEPTKADLEEFKKIDEAEKKRQAELIAELYD